MELTRPRKPTMRMMAMSNPGPASYTPDYRVTERASPRYTMTCTRPVRPLVKTPQGKPEPGLVKLKSDFERYEGYKPTALDRQVNKPVSTFGCDRFPKDKAPQLISDDTLPIKSYELAYKTQQLKQGISMSSSRTLFTKESKRKTPQPFGYDVRDKTSKECINRHMKTTIGPQLEYRGGVLLEK